MCTWLKCTTKSFARNKSDSVVNVLVPSQSDVSNSSPIVFIWRIANFFPILYPLSLSIKQTTCKHRQRFWINFYRYYKNNEDNLKTNNEPTDRKSWDSTAESTAKATTYSDVREPDIIIFISFPIWIHLPLTITLNIPLKNPWSLFIRCRWVRAELNADSTPDEKLILTSLPPNDRQTLSSLLTVLFSIKKMTEHN